MDQAQKELFAPSFCAFITPHSRQELPQTRPVCGKVPEEPILKHGLPPSPRRGSAAKRTQFSRSQPEGLTDTRRPRPFAAACSRISAVVSAVVIGAMPTGGRVYPHTALVLTWFQLKKRQRFAVHGSLPGNTSAARGSEAIALRLQEDFPGDPAETDGSAKGRTAPI